jgi:hypothetical protein
MLTMISKGCELLPRPRVHSSALFSFIVFVIIFENVIQSKINDTHFEDNDYLLITLAAVCLLNHLQIVIESRKETNNAIFQFLFKASSFCPKFLSHFLLVITVSILTIQHRCFWNSFTQNTFILSNLREATTLKYTIALFILFNSNLISDQISTKFKYAGVISAIWILLQCLNSKGEWVALICYWVGFLSIGLVMIFSRWTSTSHIFLPSRKTSSDYPFLIDKNPILEGVRSTSVCAIDLDNDKVLYFNTAAKCLFEAFKSGAILPGCQAGPMMDVTFLRIKQSTRSTAFRTETLLQEEKECEFVKLYDLIQEFLKGDAESMRFMLRKTVDAAHVQPEGGVPKRPKKISLKSTRSPTTHQERKKSSRLSLSFPFIRENTKRKTEHSIDQEEMIFDLELTSLDLGYNNQRAVIAFFTDITHVKQKTLSREFDAFKQVS